MTPDKFPTTERSPDDYARARIIKTLEAGPAWKRSFQAYKTVVDKMIDEGLIEKCYPAGGRACNMIRLRRDDATLALFADGIANGLSVAAAARDLGLPTRDGHQMMATLKRDMGYQAI